MEGAIPLDLARLYEFAAQTTIQAKDGGLMRLDKLYSTQRYFFEQIAKGLEEGIHEFVVLKGRQEGISTACDTLTLYYSQSIGGLNGMLVSPDDAKLSYRRDVLRNMHASLPMDWKYPLRLDNATVMAWDHPSESRLTFAAAGKRPGGGGRAELGKGYGLNYLQGDEAGSYRDLQAIDKVRASFSKKHPHRLYIWNSTAESFGPFHRMFKTAETATTQRALFIGPWLHEDYRVPRSNTTVWDRYGWDLTRDELDYCAAIKRRFGYIVPPEYVVWRRLTMAEEFSGDETMMLQEFPNLPEDAFQAFGDRLIPSGTIKHMRGLAEKGPKPRGYTYEWPESEAYIEDLRVVETDPATAKLRVWEEPDPLGVYVLGAHPARSSHPDAVVNSIYVFRAYRESLVQVAEFVSDDVEMFRFAWACLHLGGAYRGRLPCFFLLELQMTGDYVWREIRRIIEQGRGFRARPLKDLSRLVQPWASIVHCIYRQSDSIAGSVGRFHMRTTQQQHRALTTALRNEAERRTLVLRSTQALDELDMMRSGEHGNADEVTVGGEAGYGRAHAIALGVEAYLNDAWSSVSASVPPIAPTGPQTIANYQVATFLDQNVLNPPKPVASMRSHVRLPFRMPQNFRG